MTDAQIPERPASWYHQGAADAAAQVEAECNMPVPIHHQEIAAAHEGRPTIAEQKQRQGMS